jgi:hypothetical protein
VGGSENTKEESVMLTNLEHTLFSPPFLPKRALCNSAYLTCLVVRLYGLRKPTQNLEPGQMTLFMGIHYPFLITRQQNVHTILLSLNSARHYTPETSAE